MVIFKDSREKCHSQSTAFYKLATRKLCTDQVVHLALELVGLWKRFGHPDIDMDSSVATWLSKEPTKKENLSTVANLLVWSFRLEFSRQHYKQHRRWPRVKLGQQTPEKFRRNYNTWEERPATPWLSEDFEYVTFEKNFDFYYHVNVADLLSDISIIPEKARKRSG